MRDMTGRAGPLLKRWPQQTLLAGILLLCGLAAGPTSAETAKAGEGWAGRCLGQGRSTDEDAVHATNRDGLVEACAQITPSSILYDEQRRPCDLGLPGCSCVGHRIALRGGQAAEFVPGTSWRVCSGVMLTFQHDGNLVLYGREAKVLWASWTQGRGAVRLVLQADGNLVLADAGGKPVWTSGTFGNPGAFLAVQEDSNVVLYAGRWRPIWATWTQGQ